MIEVLEILAREALVQLCEERVRRGERRCHVRAGEQHAVARGIERHRATEGRPVGCRIGGRRVRQFDAQRMDLAPADPAAEANQRHENELDALMRHRSIPTEEHEYNPVSRAFFTDGPCQGVAEDEQIAYQALECAAQVGTGHHRVADHVEARRRATWCCARPIAGLPDRSAASSHSRLIFSVDTRLRGARAPPGRCRLLRTRRLRRGPLSQAFPRRSLPRWRKLSVCSSLAPLPAQAGLVRPIDWPSLSMTRTARGCSLVVVGAAGPAVKTGRGTATLGLARTKIEAPADGRGKRTAPP